MLFLSHDASKVVKDKEVEDRMVVPRGLGRDTEGAVGTPLRLVRAELHKIEETMGKGQMQRMQPGIPELKKEEKRPSSRENIGQPDSFVPLYHKTYIKLSMFNCS